MSDPALQWLLEKINHADNTGVWCVDENADESILALSPKSGIDAISNRWDVATALSGKGWLSIFSDFDLAAFGSNSQDHFFYRVSKEKAITHHLLNQAWRCLKQGGRLYLCGEKNEGIKTYIDKIAACFGCSKQAQKNGQAYVAILEKQQEFAATEMLDDSDYSRLRLIATEPLQIFSKPGQFGWNKLDQGSAFLVAELPRILQRENSTLKKALDLGCGYGYLTLMASQLPACRSIEDWLLTDNNAAALLSAAENMAVNGLSARVTADDCAANLETTVDLLLCNPPFHQGFSVEGELTNKFLAAARRLIARGGLAVFVVNQFIPLEKKAMPLFRQVETFATNGSFKLVILKH